MDEVGNYEGLKLENQICFPLYVCSKEIIKRYKPFLEEIDLTYTQYIVMMVMWEKKELNVRTLGEYLYLDSGTLTPVLKKLESKGYLNRSRDKEDERNLVVRISELGIQLKEKAVSVPMHIGECVNLSEVEARTLYTLLYKLMGNISDACE